MTRIVANRKWWILILAGLIWLMTAPSWSAPRVTVESGRPTRTFRVAVLLLQSTAVPYWNSDPWFMPVLNHSPLKPAGWEMENPLAPALLPNDPALVASAQQYLLDPKGAGATSTNWYTNGKQPGAPLTKDDPAYWVVKLDQKGLDALLSYDLLILNGHNEVRISNADRNNLQYLLERGATIWVNNSQRSGVQFNNIYPPILFKADPAWYNDSLGRALIKADPAHWLLNSFFALTDYEVNNLRDNKSWRSFIASGVAGYAGGGSSSIQEVVRLRPADGFPNGQPCIAAGRFGNGYVIATGTDIMGSVSDWWERKHNDDGLRDLNMWPYTRALHITGTVNDHDCYIAAAKLAFNMLNRPSSWNMAGGNPSANRTYDHTFPRLLSRGWTTGFTVLNDPVSLENYLAVAGNTSGGFAANELRVYRARRITGETGAVLDYPFGLYTELSYFLSPSLLDPPGWWTGGVTSYGGWAAGVGYPMYSLVSQGGITWLCKLPHVSSAATAPGTAGGDAFWAHWRGVWAANTTGYRLNDAVYSTSNSSFRIYISTYDGTADYTSSANDEPGKGANWTSYWESHVYFPRDALEDSEMDMCCAYGASHWIGSPVLGKIAETVNGQAVSRTVLYALKATYAARGAEWVWIYRPVCIALDPYSYDFGMPQVGTDRWAARTDMEFTQSSGMPNASMTLKNGRLVLTTFQKAVPESARIYIIDARTGDTRVRLSNNAEWNSTFRLTGPANCVAAQVDFDATPLEAGLNNESITTRDPNLLVAEMRRETVEMLVAPGEYYGPAAARTNPTVGQTALFLIPPTIVARALPPRGSFIRVPPDLRLTVPDESFTDVNGDGVYNAGEPFDDRNGNGVWDAAVSYMIGDQNNAFRQQYILNIKAQGSLLKITFRNWDAFFPQGLQNTPPLSLPLQITYTPDTMAQAAQPQPVQPGQLPLEPITVNALSMGYPILLKGTQILDTSARLTLRPYDGDGDSTFGYMVDAPSLIYANTAIVGTNTLPVNTLPTASITMDTPATRDLHQPGMLQSVRLQSINISNPGAPILVPSTGDIAWQFAGDTLGPKVAGGLQQYVWQSDFSFPAAAGKNTIYSVGNYSGYGDYLEDFYYPIAATDLPPDRPRGMLYALTPNPSFYLEQVVTAAGNANGTAAIGYQDPDSRVTFKGTIGAHVVVKIAETGTPNRFIWSGDGGVTWSAPINITGADQPLGGGVTVAFPQTFGYKVDDQWEVSPTTGVAMRQLLLGAAFKDVLRPGARALLRIEAVTPYTWELGTITAVRQDVTTNGYWVSFDRDRPTDAEIAGLPLNLLVSTSVPYVSHVKAWNKVSGAEVLRRYPRAAGNATRISEGMCGEPPNNNPANPDMRNGLSSVMLELLSQDPADPTMVYMCHTQEAYDGSMTAVPQDSDFLPDGSPELASWRSMPHTYIPSRPRLNGTNYAGMPEQNYIVDYLTGRIRLSPQIAGEYADRFILVHYFTTEMVNGVMTRVRHAEVMHVPSQIKWSYQFDDAVPDSGPVVVNDTVYVTANQRDAATGRWRPVLYAFPSAPADPRNARPKWVQPLDVTVTGDAIPYRGVTSATPTDNGVLVGTGLPGATNGLTMFDDRGLYIADGHRMLRADNDGRVSWQASATIDFDPAALASGNALVQMTGVLQQDYTLITRMHKLPNGNMLVCDTGGNRVVETDRNGQVRWQYPDSDVAYQDMDREYQANTDVPSRTNLALLRKPTPDNLRVNGPRDARRYIQDVTINPWVDSASRTNGVVTIVTTAAHGIPVNTQINIRVAGMTDPSLNGKFAAVVTAPDAISYQQAGLPNKAVGPETGIVITERLLPVAVNWQGLALTANIRWDVTLIADTGNTRILEVARPLVRFLDPNTGQDLEEVTIGGRQITLAHGYNYRPDVTYAFNGNAMALNQRTETIADANTVALDAAMLGTPMLFTAAMRYAGPDNGSLDAQYETDPVLAGVRSRDVLAVIGNAVNDPLVPNTPLRTVHLRRPLFPSQKSTAPEGFSQYSVNVVNAPDATSLIVGTTDSIKVGARVQVKEAANAEYAIVKAVDGATGKVTFTVPLRNAYTAAALMFFPEPAEIQKKKTVVKDGVTVDSANALYLRPVTPNPMDYSRVRQLDLITLRNPLNGTQEVRVLVVDQAGVREVPADPARLGVPVFEMSQAQYEVALASMNPQSIVNVRFADQPLTERERIKRVLAAWQKDTYFQPVSVLRLDPARGETTTDPHQVRYLIGQMNNVPSLNQEAWIEGKAVPRIHLFEARWVDGPGWSIMDSNADYFIYPDPATAGFPDLPGGSYSLSEPLGIERD